MKDTTITHIGLTDLQVDIYMCDLLDAEKSRQSEKQTEAFLLEKIFGEQQQLEHNEQGKPFIRNKEINITISHSKSTLCMALSRTRIIGIDIEELHPRLRRVSERFLPQNNKEEDLSLLQLAVYWSVREAVYKVAGSAAGAVGEHVIFDTDVVGYEGEQITTHIGEVTYNAQIVSIKSNFEVVLAWKC